MNLNMRRPVYDNAAWRQQAKDFRAQNKYTRQG